MTDKLATQLAAASSEEELSKIMNDHEESMEVLEARFEREKCDQLKALKKRLAERRNKKMAGLKPAHVHVS